MVGQGCEWRLDPTTGKAACLGTVTRTGMGNSRFGFGPDGKLYLAVTAETIHGPTPVYIYERQGDGQYKLRTVVSPGKEEITVWADENDDVQEQPSEVSKYTVKLGGWISGWYMPMTPDLSFYGSLHQVRVDGYTACGAPKYDFSKATKVPGPANAASRGGMGAQHGHGSADNRLMLWNCGYGADHSSFDCYDIESGKLLWTYPSNFTGVHGSHRAGPPEPGLIRGAYDITGSAKLPDPIGNVWVIPTNKGEWHVLTEKGYYLTHLFESDPMKVVWPDKAEPGAVMDACPPGAGEEAFGGSITHGKDGKLYVTAGHTGYLNLEVTGLETVKALPSSGRVSIAQSDLATAQSFHDQAMQASIGTKRLVVKKATPAFTGDLNKDFAKDAIVSYQKQESAGIRTAMAWDDANLYVGWEVRDDTPWINGADAPEFLYARGDTVDLQLGTDPAGDKNRAEAAAGDLRLSIGSFQGKTTAVIYRKVSAEKHPKTFSSGVVAAYPMDSVIVLDNAKVQAKADAAKKRYVVEATIPLSALGLKPTAGLSIRGDFGVTHGDKAGRDTALRTYWSNQETGIVSDEVFELKMQPKNWAEIRFE